MTDLAEEADGDRETSTTSKKDETYWKNYVEYNKGVRTWLVTFGVGALVLLLSHPKLIESLKQHGSAKSVMLCLLLGCGAQVAVALINKICAWHQATGEELPEFKRTKLYKVLNWIGGMFVIDVLFDLGSIIAFVLAIYAIAGAILGDSSVLMDSLGGD